MLSVSFVKEGETLRHRLTNHYNLYKKVKLKTLLLVKVHVAFFIIRSINSYLYFDRG
jgi:hypothetical protein